MSYLLGVLWHSLELLTNCKMDLLDFPNSFAWTSSNRKKISTHSQYVDLVDLLIHFPPTNSHCTERYIEWQGSQGRKDPPLYLQGEKKGSKTGGPNLFAWIIVSFQIPEKLTKICLNLSLQKFVNDRFNPRTPSNLTPHRKFARWSLHLF